MLVLHIMEAGALNVRTLGRCEVPAAVTLGGSFRGNIKLTGADMGGAYMG